MRNPWLVSFLLMGSVMVSSAGERTLLSPVVVELFESQGCSSCPPSEDVLARLKKEFGDSVMLLTFHVDYWDDLGWKDPFSNPAFTQRQKEYARRLGQPSMYTPEMIIQGRKGFVGSDGKEAGWLVQQALAQRPSVPAAHVEWLDAQHVKVSVGGLGDHFKGMRPTAVLFEDAPPVHVLRGENSGATMSGDNVVRLIKEMPDPEKGRTEVELLMPAPRGRGSWRAAVLIADSDDLLLTTPAVSLR